MLSILEQPREIDDLLLLALIFIFFGVTST